MEARFIVTSATITDRRETAAGIYQLTLKVEDPKFYFTPGQYVWVRLSELQFPDERGAQRAFSFCTLPSSLPEITLVFRKSESGYKKTLLSMPVGSKVELSGPFGFFVAPEDTRPMVCIAGGTGITPFVSIIRQEIEKKSDRSITVLYATHAPDMATFKDEILEIAKTHPNILLFHTVGKITDAFVKDHTGAIENPHWYISGPDAMVTSVTQLVLRMGVSEESLIFDQFCGLSSTEVGQKGDQLLSTELQKFKLAIESATNHIIITNTNGIILYANPAAETITGYKISEMIGNTPRLWGGLMSREFYQKLWHTIKFEKKPFAGEVLNHRKDYSLYTAYTRISPVLSDSGNLIGFVGTEEDVSERLRMQRELESKEKRFQTLIEKSSEVVILTNDKGIVTYVTPPLIRVLGYTPEEYVGKNALIYVHEEDMAMAQKLLGEIVQTPGASKTAQLRVRHKDGSWRWIEATGTNLLADPSIHAIVTDVRDVTDTRIAAEALKASESEYRNLFQNELSGYAHCQMIYEGDTPVDFIYLQINSAFERLTGLTNIVGKKATEIFPEIRKEEPELIAAYGRVATTGVTEKFETYFGALKIWLDISVYSSKKGYFTAIFDNITERKKYEETIENEKAQDEAMLNSLGDGLVVVNTDNDIIVANPRVLEMLGKKREEVIGKKYPDVWNLVDETGTELPDADRPIRKALDGKFVKTTLTDGYYFGFNDKRIAVTTSAAPVLFKDKVIGAVAVIHDVTEEREIDKAKTEFVSLASHQLRTPLSTIGWYSEMLLAGDAGAVTAEQKSYLEEIYGGNKRMVDLVNGLLNVSRIEMGTFGIEPESVDVKKLVESALKDIAQEVQAKDLDVKTSYDDVTTVSADPKILQLIFQNLISNAVRYTAIKGSVTIAISKKDADILISVSDTGIGIPEKMKEKIFTKLYRADNAKITQPDGNGLGLYMVKSILEHAGGKIWLESAEGKGSTFYVTIPLAGMKAKAGLKNLI